MRDAWSLRYLGEALVEIMTSAVEAWPTMVVYVLVENHLSKLEWHANINSEEVIQSRT